MSLSQKPNRYGFDPFLIIDTAKANYFYGRTDVPPDTEEGQRQAELDAARDVDPEIDRTLPWTLLMGGMFSFLYKEAIRNENRRAGRKKRGPYDPFPRPIRFTPQRWAECFNIITVKYIDNEFLRRPDKVSEQKLSNGRKVALLMMLQDPGKGAAKTRDYLSPERLRETKLRLRRMERHRLEMAESPRVQKHLQSLRSPAVN
jgi:hypothetical protein